jgi:hypothetical protein
MSEEIYEFIFTDTFINYGKQYYKLEELDGPAVSALGVRPRKLSNFLNAQS